MKRFNFSLSDALHAELQNAAKEQGVSMASICREALEDILGVAPESLPEKKSTLADLGLDDNWECEIGDTPTQVEGSYGFSIFDLPVGSAAQPKFLPFPEKKIASTPLDLEDDLFANDFLPRIETPQDVQSKAVTSSSKQPDFAHEMDAAFHALTQRLETAKNIPGKKKEKRPMQTHSYRPSPRSNPQEWGFYDQLWA